MASPTMKLLDQENQPEAAAEVEANEETKTEAAPAETAGTEPVEVNTEEGAAAQEAAETVEWKNPLDALIFVIGEMANLDLMQFAKDHGIEVPGFSKMKVAEKRAALRAYVVEHGVPEKKAGTAVAVAKAAGDQGAQVTVGVVGEVIDPDPISTFNHKLGMLSEAEAAPLARHLLDQGDFNDFQAGGIFAKVQDEGWFGGHPNFRGWVEAEFGMDYRKAAYLANIYRKIVEANVKWSDVAGVGWTKLKELVPILTSANAKHWAQIAGSMTTLQLNASVKQAVLQAQGQGAAADGAVPENKASVVTTKTFKVHQDQKEVIQQALNIAKNKLGTDVDTVALEHICIGYIGAPVEAAPTKVAPTKESLAQTFAALKALGEGGLERVFEAFEAVWPEVHIIAKMPD